MFSACDYVNPWDFKDDVDDSFDETVQEFVDNRLRTGKFTVCKIAGDDTSLGFDFNGSVRSPRTHVNQDLGPITLKDGECEDLWIPGPAGETGAPDSVDVAEIVPDGWHNPVLTIITLDGNDSSPVYDDAMGPSYTGLVKRGQIGALVVFNNKKKKSW